MEVSWKSKLGEQNEHKQNGLVLPIKKSAKSCKITGTIQIRKLDKLSTHADLKLRKCTVEGCKNTATHWLTRQNAEYCQSDMVCDQHAKIWMEVRDLVS